MGLRHSASLEDSLQPSPAKSSCSTYILIFVPGHIILNAGKIFPLVVFPAPGKVFHPVFILNGDEDPASPGQMGQQDLQEIFIGSLSANVTLSILKDPDQTDIIEIPGQPRLYILKIPHMNGHIFTCTMPVGVDHATFPG